MAASDLVFFASTRHPLEATPWWFRWYVTAKRAVHLITVFVPFAAVSLAVTVFSEDIGLREYWLDMMIRTLEKAGCSFMKFGQWLSMRPDLFPQDVIQALSKLRNDAPAHSWEHTRQSIKDSFGLEIEDLFDRFEEKPVASGTIAQVHRAFLKEEHAMPGGVREVAVKVRHPNVVQESYVDTSLLFEALDVIGQTLLKTTQPFDKRAFNQALQRQVDLKWEAYNLQLFACNFYGETEIKFPQVCSALVSDMVLVESWINGKVVQDIFAEVGEKVGENLAAGQKKAEQALARLSDEILAQRRKMARIVFDMNMKMFLRDNYVHGDLHGGNLMAADDGTLTVFDAGLTCRLHPDIAQPFGYFLQAMCTGNTDRVVEKLVLFNEVPIERIDLQKFHADMHALVKEYVGDSGMDAPDGKPINMGEMVGSILTVMQKHKMRLRGDIAVNIMTMALSEGLIRQLDPDFDVVRSSLPYFVRFRSWQPAQTDLTGDSWDVEIKATNGGLPTSEAYARNKDRQVTTI
jgi:aarF domain-containing kinase